VTFPDFEALLLPLLESIADGAPHSINALVPAVARRLKLTPEEIARPLPNHRNTMLEYRLHWARTVLHKAELVTLPGELLIQITDRGRSLLKQDLHSLDQSELTRLSPSFARWQMEMGDVKLAPDLRADQQTVWVVRAGEGGTQAAAFLRHSVVAIGFGAPGDLVSLDRDAILASLKETNPKLSRRTIGQNANALFRFAHVVREGDIVLTPEPGSRSFLLGEVSGSYTNNPKPLIADYTAQRPVRWFARISRSDLSHGARSSLGSIMTFFQPGYQPELIAVAKPHWHEGPPQPAPSVPARPTPSSSIERVTIPADVVAPEPYRGESFATDKQALLYLLDQIDNRQLALPDFQRTFVWEPSATRELIVSVMQGFPAGGLLFLRNDGQTFAPRAVEGAPALRLDSPPPYLILDGQQRLSSLYYAFYGAGKHSFFLDVGALIRDASINEAVKVLPDRLVDTLRSIEAQSEMLMMPLARVRESSDWADEVLDARQHFGEDSKHMRTLLRAVDKAYVEPIRQYDFPVTTLPTRLPLEAVCTVFETLNRTGVPLSTFELICARAFADGESLLHKWREARDAHPILTDFDVDPYYLLQVIALRRGASCKRGPVLNLPAAVITEEWDRATADFAAVLRMLRDDCGVLVHKWLPYNPMLIPLATAWRVIAATKGPAVASQRVKAQRWFWCTAFTGEYESSSVSLSERDAPALSAWLAGGDEPSVVRDFVFDPERWRHITPRQQGAYRATMALLNQFGARDFHTGMRLTPETIAENAVDDHHIFPRGYFKDQQIDYPVDTVLNHTLIDRLTNIRISKRPPSHYLGEIRSELGDRLNLVLESHHLPIGNDGPLWRDDFSGFCVYRLHALTELLRTATR
jgi:hypothetical protein